VTNLASYFFKPDESFAQQAGGSAPTAGTGVPVVAALEK